MEKCTWNMFFSFQKKNKKCGKMKSSYQTTFILKTWFPKLNLETKLVTKEALSDAEQVSTGIFYLYKKLKKIKPVIGIGYN